MTQIQELTIQLGQVNYEGHTFNCLPILGQQEVLQVIVSELDAMPIFVTITDTQILCITYLCKQAEVQPDRTAELNKNMLELNVAMPLSSFAIVEDYYVVFGAMATSSSFDDDGILDLLGNLQCFVFRIDRPLGTGRGRHLLFDSQLLTGNLVAQQIHALDRWADELDVAGGTDFSKVRVLRQKP